jgi:prolyl-tRNA synthetase
LIPTLKEDPSDAVVASHKLMVRAGMIRQLTAGVYSYLPLGLRSVRKVAQIVREEMDRAGAIELFLPAMQPAELWKESGRWNEYGKELFRFQDRHSRQCCLGPTHEEVITDLVRHEIRSYRQLPINLYQIQTKFRDEIRPRFGVMRGREFGMKDAYSFDAGEEGAEASYRKMYDAYCRIFERCGLTFKVVEADSGPIGGSYSHEFMVMAASGEDLLVSCKQCDYAANVEKAEIMSPKEALHPDEGLLKELKKVSTPNMRTIEEVAAFLGVEAHQLIKTILYDTDQGPVALLVRGDHEVNEIKAKNHLGAQSLSLASDEMIEELTKSPKGFAGPVGLGGGPDGKKILVLADHAVREVINGVVGGNENDVHLANVNYPRDYGVDIFGDFRVVQEGDRCPRCGEHFSFDRGIEVGHVFKLGTKYSQAMGATYLDEKGEERMLVMGCYGIGIERTVAAAIEQNHDEDGIIFPNAIAPFSVLVLSINPEIAEVREASESVYRDLLEAGTEVLFDDRQDRPGIKFKDADLIGIPFRINVGAKSLKNGCVEVRNRMTKEIENIKKDDVVSRVRELLHDQI